MDRKPKKKLFIILTLIVICIIFFAALRYIQRLKHCNLSTIPKKSTQNQAPPKSGLKTKIDMLEV